MKRRDNAKSHFRKAFPAALGGGAPRYLQGSSNGIRSGCKTLSGGPTRSVNGMQGEKRLLCHKSPIYDESQTKSYKIRGPLTGSILCTIFTHKQNEFMQLASW